MNSLGSVLFDSNGPFGLQEGFAQNLLAGSIQFVFDVALISILVPIIFRYLENRRWRSSRRLLGERLFQLNEQVDLWWNQFTRRALEPGSYDGTVSTPDIFTKFDRLIEQFTFVMNSNIANSYSDYRLALGRIESLYRRLCLSFGAAKVGNILLYSQDIVATEPVSFKDIKDSFTRLLKALDYTPTQKIWWEQPDLKEAKPSPYDMIDSRQEQADLISKHMPPLLGSR